MFLYTRIVFLCCWLHWGSSLLCGFRIKQNFEEAQKEAEDAAKLTVDDVADGTTLETLKDAITLAEAVENAPTWPR